MRRYILAANWKMNKTYEEANDFLGDFTDWLETNRGRFEDRVDIVLCPPYPYLELAVDLAEERDFYVGAQDVSAHDDGAYTGDVSAKMLESLAVTFAIVGHSERRQYHGETDEIINAKLKQLMATSMIPILCIGESEAERVAGKTIEVLERQLTGAFQDITFEDETAVLIAYEPVWAIGTGRTATPEIAQEAHAFIRAWLGSRYGEDAASTVPLLYGGSMNEKNVEGLLAQRDIDGGLIGGASLDLKKYEAMIESALKMATK